MYEEGEKARGVRGERGRRWKREGDENAREKRRPSARIHEQEMAGG